MFKNKLLFLIVASLVATSAMTAGPAHSEVCVENDAGLSEQQLSVAFTATKDASPQNPIDWNRLPNGNGVRNNLSSIENYQNRNCKKGEEGTITQI